MQPTTTPSATQAPQPPDVRAPSAEFAEADAMMDFYACAPTDFARSAGVIAKRLGSLRIIGVATVPSAFFNRIVGLGLAEPATPAMLDDAVALLEDAGCRHFMVQLCPHAQPRDVSEWLLARRFLAGQNWVKMYRGTEPVPEIPCDLRIEVVDEQYADAFAAIALDAFAMPSVLGHMMGAHLGKPGWRNYLVFDGSRPVAGATMRMSEDVAWLGLGATLASHRGRGTQRALLARRIEDGIAAGCRAFYAETGEPVADERNPSYANMLRVGFKPLYLRRNYVKRPGV